MMSKRRVDRAIILAAGRGSRLAQGDMLPKPLRTVSGTPLLVRILRTLAKEGIREVVVIVGFEGQRIRDALVDVGDALGVELHFRRELPCGSAPTGSLCSRRRSGSTGTAC